MLSLVSLLCISSPSAHAIEPERSRDGDWVVVSAHLPYSTASIKGLLRQDAKTMSLGKDIRSVKTKPLPNGCTHLEVVNEGLTRTMSYTAERCLVENGWHSKMLESPDFEDHQIIWTTVPEGEGSRVTIRVKVSLRMPVPRFMVTPFVGAALEETLLKMDSLLSG